MAPVEPEASKSEEGIRWEKARREAPCEKRKVERGLVV